ncbi:hypothetical protein SGRIM128S_07220 [Streptomyces griseomycini]
MTFGRSIASCTTLGSASASANSRNDSSTTTRSRSAIASMNCTTACLWRKPPSGLFGLQITATRVPRARTNSAYCARSRAKPPDSWSGNMSTRLPVSMGWSVQRPKVGTGTASDSRTSKWSIQVMSSVEPLPIATHCGGSRSRLHSSAVMVSALLG